MKRYFFDLHDGVVSRDLAGTLFVNEGGARQEAKLRALHQRQTHSLQVYDGFECIAVRDESDRIVYKVAISH